MYEELYQKYFHKDFSAGKRCFFLAGFSSVAMVITMMITSVVLRAGFTTVFFQFLALILLVVNVYFGQQSERYVLCSAFLGFFVNLVYLPSMYVFRNELICGIIVYSIFGTLLCAIAMEGVAMLVSIITVLCFYAFCFYYVYINNDPLAYLSISSVKLLIEMEIATVFCGLVGGFCMKKKVEFYSQETEKAKNKMAEAENTSEAKNIFLSNISHEIRTPMNAILGTSQLLLGADISDMAKDKVMNILNACNALLSTVNDLLDFSRIESGDITIEEEEYNLEELLSDIINMISIRVMDRQIEFLVDIKPEVPDLLYGDSKRLRQIFINILNNSVKYTKEGYIYLMVDAETIAPNKINLKVAVRDTGIGIKPEDKDRIFRDFERIDTKDSGLDGVEGTGLGLSICKSIVTAMNGDISFESTYGVGTEFRFSVPQIIVGYEDEFADVDKSQIRVLVFEKNEECDKRLTDALDQCGVAVDSAIGAVMFRSSFMSGKYTHVFIDRNNYRDLKSFLGSHLGDAKLTVVTDINQTNVDGYQGTILVRPAHYKNVSAVIAGKSHNSIRKMSISGEFICPNARIMVVDDNLTNLQVVESILTKYQIQVFTASGGRECLYKLESEQVDLIFLDYMMPEMDGIDTLKAIRAVDKKWMTKVPIVALTANTVGGVREMLLSEGFDEYLSKPLEIDKLEKCLKIFLEDEMIKPVVEGNTEE